jgi:hypothetical protein
MKFRLVAWNFVTAVVLAGCCNPPPDHSLPVTLRLQETDSWCWAASGEMIMEYLGASIEQCDAANKQFERNDCCNSPVPWPCIDGGWPQFDKYGFTSSNTTNAALSWTQVKSQLYCKKKPFAFTWKFLGGGGHMMVAAGYRTVNGINFVYGYDPLPFDQLLGAGKAYIPYQTYVSGSDYTHWDDYYDVTKK